MHVPKTESSRHLALLELAWTFARDAKFAADARTGLIFEANPAAERLTGYSRDELITMRATQLHPPEEIPAAMQEFQRAAAESVSVHGFHVLHKDGHIVPVVINTSEIRIIDGVPVTFAVFRDIADITLNEQRLAHQSWALSAYARAAVALSQCRSSQQLLDSICQSITTESEYLLAWIGLADHDDRKSIRQIASAGKAVHYLDDANFSWSADDPTGRGPTAMSLRTGLPQLLHNFATEPAVAFWAERARSFGIHSSLSVPFDISQNRRAALMIYSADPTAFNPKAVEVFHNLATQIGHGLHAIEQEIDLNQKREQLQKAQEQITDTLTKTIGAMARTMELRDPYTAGHESRVAALANAIGNALGWDDSRLQPMHLAAMVHDMGKITIPIEILTKPTRLSIAEYDIIKEHPETAYTILKDIPFSWPIADIVRQHHEKLDGSGYPLGLTAEKILPESRVLAIADIVEALSSARPYRPARGIEAALDEIEKLAAAGKLDPDIVRVCCDLFRRQGYTIPSPHY